MSTRKDPRVLAYVNRMRVCTQDCDNPEIPGSGYTCGNLRGSWRECVSH